MIIAPQLAVEWLTNDTAVSAAVSGRVSTLLVPDEGLPAIVIGPVNGGPPATGGASQGPIETWAVPLYCVTGRGGSGMDDQPDMPGAWALADLVVAAMAKLDWTHYRNAAAEIVSARIISVSGSTDASGSYGRVTVTASLRVIRR